MSSRWSARRTQFRGILAGGACVHPASVHDAVSARIAADLDFELGMFAGSVASLAVLGAPDLIVLTLSEFADQAYRIGRAAELPLLVDADHGYGNALNVMRTVEELENAGVAALSIEDTALPRGYGPSDKAELLSIEEGIGKMKSALAARRDADLAIVGRTSAMAITGVEDAIRRAKAYEAAASMPCSWSASSPRTSSKPRRRSCASPSYSGVEPPSATGYTSRARACACRYRVTSRFKQRYRLSATH